MMCFFAVCMMLRSLLIKEKENRNKEGLVRSGYMYGIVAVQLVATTCICLFSGGRRRSAKNC